MAFISFKPNSHFNTILWTGDGGGSKAITGVGFQPDFTWVKRRELKDHHWYDAVRGVTKALASNNTDSETTKSTGLTAFGSDGFTLGSDSGVNASGGTYVAWNWKMGTTSGLSGGTITPSAYTINTTTKCGAYAYTGNGTLGATIPHGLGVKPAFVIIKPRDLTDLWAVGHQHINMAGDKYLRLNEVNAVYSAGALFNSTNINDSTTVIKVGDNAATNQNTKLYIMYVFAETNGFSRFGQYQGTGSATVTPSIFCGFKPSMLMIKQSDGSGDWYVYDNKRETLQGDANSKSINPNDNNIRANKNEAETTSGNFDIDLISTGFTVRCTNTEINGSGGHYIYAAFAEYPFIGSNSNPGKGG